MVRVVLCTMGLLCVAHAAGGQPSRPASAMQRVTGALHARHALEPLDSILAVRVMDARGAELPGVVVRWSLADAADGATLTVLNARTDSLGMSRATLTPGRSADAQLTVAEVRGVGRLEFAVTIPPAGIRIVPRQFTLRSGDDSLIVAELRDARGAVLAGGNVRWAVNDTNVARVTAESGARARVRGGRAGTTRVVAWVGDGRVRDTARVMVRPVIVGEFVTVDGDRARDVQVELRAAGTRDSMTARDGRFTARFDFPPGEAVIIHATPSDTNYHDAAVRVDDERELQRLAIALVPRTFQVDAGSHAGQTVRIDARSAMARVGGSAPFWRLVPYSGDGPRKLLGWRESDLPLRIAFARERSAEPIAAGDSIAFWEIAHRMERDIGRALFVPADHRSDSARTGFIRVEVRPHAAEGHTFVAWAQSGDASEGVLLFRRAAILHDAHVVTHELVHLLGFGHSTSWPSVAQPSAGTHPGLTPEDVGYIQLAMKLRRLQETVGARPGLPLPSPAPRDVRGR